MTNSSVRIDDNLGHYTTCVENLSQESDLFVNWYIPGHTGYVPYGEVSVFPRVSDDLEPLPVTGCVAYGRLGNQTYAQFMGSAEERDKARDEKCTPIGQGTKDLSRRETLPKIEFQNPVKLFFPSDPERAHDTMLVLNGVVGIKPIDGTFKTFFQYSLERYQDRPDGSPAEVFIHPSFPVQTEALMAAFMKENDEESPLTYKGIFAFTLPQQRDASGWEAATASYELKNSNGDVLSAVPIPLILRSSQ